MDRLAYLKDKINAGKPKNKRLKFTPRTEGIIVTREKEESLPVSAFVGGEEYARNYQFGNPSSEALVRKNLALFIGEVRAAVKMGLKDGRLTLHLRLPDMKNSINDVEKICADYDGIDARGFVDTKGEPLARDEAFRYAIRQFFKDEEFAKSVCRIAIHDYKAGAL
ncbi:MAG: hypothetical protein NT051_04380 [Candidatus Micrarchaeota archaeon]|nr:hypothetical protein [Candidatus Micrarchaeota archaeon]